MKRHITHAVHHAKVLRRGVAIIHKSKEVQLLTFFVVLVASVLAMREFLAMESPMLLIGNAPDNASMLVFDTKTQTLSPIEAKGRGCMGIAKEPNTDLVRVSCASGEADRFALKGSVVTDLVSSVDANTTTSVSPLVCANDGLCVHGRGQHLSNGTSDGRLVLTRGKFAETAIPLPDHAEGGIPSDLEIVGDMVYVLARRPDQPATIHRFNLVSQAFEGETIMLSADAYALEASEQYLVATLYRKEAKHDVVVYHTKSGAWAGQITLSSDAETWNAFDLTLEDGSVLTVATVRGVFRYRLNDLALLGENTSFTGARALATSKKYLYVSIPAERKVYELDRATLQLVRKLDVNPGDGVLATL